MKKIFYLTVVILITGCIGNDLKYKEAKFNRDPQEVIEDLKRIHDFENANIKWTVSQFDQDISHNLKVFLTNGKNLPESDSLKNKIGKEAMQLVLNSIENDTAYNDFVVYFITENKNGVVNIRSEIPFSYQLEDFE
jgi:hypothetical protein